MTQEQLRLQMLSGIITESEYRIKMEELNSSDNKESLNEHIVGMGAINNPFADRKKETYEDAFEHFLSSKYELNESEEDKDEEEEELDEAKKYGGNKGDEKRDDMKKEKEGHGKGPKKKDTAKAEKETDYKK